MKFTLKAALGAGLLALAACGGQGDDSLGDNVADNAEAVAGNIEAAGAAPGNGRAGTTREGNGGGRRGAGAAQGEGSAEPTRTPPRLTDL